MKYFPWLQCVQRVLAVISSLHLSVGPEIRRNARMLCSVPLQLKIGMAKLAFIIVRNVFNKVSFVPPNCLFANCTFDPTNLLLPPPLLCKLMVLSKIHLALLSSAGINPCSSNTTNTNRNNIINTISNISNQQCRHTPMYYCNCNYSNDK